LPAALAVVIHSPADAEGYLPSILSRLTPAPVAFCHDGEPIRAGRIVVAPPNRHLLIEGRRYRLSEGPRENGFRPAADPLFRTAAHHFGANAIGVVLSGALDDGTHGLSVIKDRGGLAIAQHPDDAAVPGMPQNAIAHVEIDHVVAASEIAPLIIAACAQNAKRGTKMSASNHTPPAEIENEPLTIPRHDRLARKSVGGCRSADHAHQPQPRLSRPRSLDRANDGRGRARSSSNCR
jgi:two-component system chemotaxis response regulator CheB